MLPRVQAEKNVRGVVRAGETLSLEQVKMSAPAEGN
jgi:hypothetical protein